MQPGAGQAGELAALAAAVEEVTVPSPAQPPAERTPDQGAEWTPDQPAERAPVELPVWSPDQCPDLTPDQPPAQPPPHPAQPPPAAPADPPPRDLFTPAPESSPAAPPAGEPRAGGAPAGAAGGALPRPIRKLLQRARARGHPLALTWARRARLAALGCDDMMRAGMLDGMGVPPEKILQVLMRPALPPQRAPAAPRRRSPSPRPAAARRTPRPRHVSPRRVSSRSPSPRPSPRPSSANNRVSSTSPAAVAALIAEGPSAAPERSVTPQPLPYGRVHGASSAANVALDKTAELRYRPLSPAREKPNRRFHQKVNELLAAQQGLSILTVRRAE
eukprot:TRINITY_DN4305_c0_g2_i1.p2 TRINITY_DN4305_c0_g2~~TRINITY_DN4305_c0_g2_i1.p2  ORF type:complete len:332 (+),score=87.82 TRINITY_DN4305_c0_g2_i1:118-1113(+)